MSLKPGDTPKTQKTKKKQKKGEKNKKPATLYIWQIAKEKRGNKWKFT